MSKQYTGGLITKTPVVPTSLSASGVWSLSDQAEAQATNTWPFPRDPQFNYVTMLLHGDGSAGPVAMGSGAGTSSTVTAFNTDASTNNFNVAINGDARSNNFTPYQGNGYYSNLFNGTNAELTCTGSALSGEFTMEGWVYFSTASFANGTTYFGISSNSGGYIRQETSSTITFNNAGVGTSLTGSFTPIANTWYHIAATRNSSNLMTLWVNGSSVGSATVSTSYASGTFAIGANHFSGGTTGWFPGYISNVRLVTGSCLYTSTFTPSTTPLTAVSGTQVLTCQSNRFIDNSTNAYTITVNGTPQVSPAQPFTLPSSVATYGSAYLDGSGDYLTTPSSALISNFSGDFTIEGWVYLTATTANGVLVGGNGSSGWYVEYGSSRGFGAYDGSIFISGSSTAVTNQWVNFAVTRASGTVRFFINGALTASASSANFNVTQSLGIGAYSGGSSSLSGYLSNVRINNTSALYTASYTPSTTPLTAITNTSLLTTQYNGGGNNSGFKDSSQNNFVITRNGNTTQGTFTPYSADWSNYFDGSSNLALSSAPVSATGAFTVECWVFVTGTAASQSIYSQYLSADGGRWMILWNDTANKFTFAVGASTSYDSTNTYAANTWHHIAWVRDGSNNLSFYIDGVRDSTNASVTTSLSTSNPIIANRNGGATPYYGYISNLRITNTAVYSGTTYTVPTIPLTNISGTTLLTCQSNRFVDNETTAKTFTITGSPSVQGFSPFAPLTVYNPATYGGSGYFDGTGDSLTTASNANFGFGTGDFTIECWAYPLASTAQRLVFFDNDINNLDIGFSPANTFQYYNGSVNNTGISAASRQWFHFAVSRISGTTSVYINGVRTNNITDSTDTTTRAVQIGNSPSSNPFNGYISDVRIIKGTGIYSGTTITVPTAPLTPITNTSLLLNYTNPAILDNSMLNNLETVGNAQISTSVVKYGTASMYFAGSSPYGYLKGNANLSQNVAFGAGDFTVECWVNLTTTASDSVIMDTRPGSNSANYFLFYLWTNGGAQLPTIAWYSPTSYVLSTGTVSSGTWTHIAICRASGTIRSFKDGVLQQSASDTRSYANPGAPYPYIGAAYGVGVDSFKGYIDDFRITKYARYTATFTPPTQAFPNG